MKGIKHFLGLVAAVGVASTGYSQSLVDVAFNWGSPAPVGAAFLGTATDQWNAFNASSGGSQGPFSLLDANGNATSVQVAYTCEGAVAAATNPSTQPLPALMHFYMFNNTGQIPGTPNAVNVQLTGLLANQDYQLILYMASDDSGGGARSVLGQANGTAFAASGDPQTSFVNLENMVNLQVTSDATGAINIVEGDGPSNTTGEVDMNGLQIQAVPEPASLAILGLGISGLVFRKSRRS